MKFSYGPAAVKEELHFRESHCMDDMWEGEGNEEA